MLLDFGSETRRLNEIINKGALTAMNNKKLLEKEIAKWKKSPKRQYMFIGEKYYEGDHEILKRKRTVIGEGGQTQEVENLPNNKNVDNQYAKLVDQKVNYILGRPLTFDSENKVYEKGLKEILDKRFLRSMKNVCENSLNSGIAWLHPYFNDLGKLSFKRFNAHEILPFWKDADHTELDFALRLFQVEGYEGEREVIIEKVEVYHSNGIDRYVLQNNTLIPDFEFPSSTHLIIEDEEGNALGHNWARVPLVAFKYNHKEIPLISRVKSLQDGINTILSDFQNNMQEDARNTILVLKNYDGTNLGEFRRNLAQYGVVKVKSIDGSQGGIDTLTVEVNADNYKAILEIFKKALIENGRGFDAAELKSSNSPNEMNIKSIFNEIDLDANGMETEYQASFEELLWFVNQYLANTGKGDFDGEEVDVIFNRDNIINESQIITDLKNSVGILSDETLVAQHPYVDDVEIEMQRKEKEKEMSLPEYMKAFPQQQQGSGIDED